MPTAPGIGFDAPSAASGKTLLARVLGILATGVEPSILPPAEADEETRKRLFAALRDGYRVVLWDNVRDPLGCAALDSFLTASTFADRILGCSETAALPNRAMFIATGNNLQLASDTCRRVLLSRMDAQTDKPYVRDFPFDPAAVVMNERPQLVAAALAIMVAYITVGRPKVAVGRTASFEVWDALVRQPICWLAGLVAEHNAAHLDDPLPVLADPMKAAAIAYEGDAETCQHTALMEAWFERFEDRPMTVVAVIEAVTAEAGSALKAALEEIGGQGGGRINGRTMANWLSRVQGRRAGGRWFERLPRNASGARWRVRQAR